MHHDVAVVDLEITTTRIGDVVTIAVGGEVDTANLAQLRATDLSALQSPTGELVIDLSAVTFMDSAELGHLMVVLRAARPRPVRLLVGHPAVLRRFHTTGLTGAFDVQDVA